MQHVRDPDILRILRACAVPSPSAACGSDRTVRAAAGTATAATPPSTEKPSRRPGSEIDRSFLMSESPALTLATAKEKPAFTKREDGL
jgi:hypothetical protein